MTVNSPPEQNKMRPASPAPFQRNKFSQSFSVSRGRTPRHRPIRTSPMSDFLYSPTTATHVTSSPYSNFFGSNDKTDENRSNKNNLLLSPASTSTRTSKVKIKQYCDIHVFLALSFVPSFYDTRSQLNTHMWLGSDDSGFSSTLTSPGIIKSALASTARTQNTKKSDSTVFGSLYKPDLIKMSSPTRRQSFRSQDGEISRT